MINGSKRREEIKRRASRGRLSNEKKGEGALNRANLTYEYRGSRERVSIYALESLSLIEQFYIIQIWSGLWYFNILLLFLFFLKLIHESRTYALVNIFLIFWNFFPKLIYFVYIYTYIYTYIISTNLSSCKVMKKKYIQ